MPRTSIYRSDVRTAVGRLLGAIVRRTTATGGTTTTLIDTKAISTSTEYLQGFAFILRPGTSTQEKRSLGAFTVSSDTWAVAPALTNAPANADVYEVWDESIITIDQVEGIIDNVFAAVFHSSGIRVSNDSLIVDDVMYGLGGFERAFVSTVPYGFVNTNTTTSQQTADFDGDASEYLVHTGKSSLKMVSDGTNALTSTHYLIHPQDLASYAIELRAWVFTTTASRVTLELGDGVTADTASTSHAGTGWRDLTTGNVTFGAVVAQAHAEVIISAGGAVTAYVDRMRALHHGRRVLRYYLPFLADRIERVMMEDTQGRFSVEIPGGQWKLEEETHAVIEFASRAALVRDRRLLILGTQVPPRWTDDTTAISLTDEQYTALVNNAVAEALGSIGTTNEQELARLQYWESRAGVSIARADNRRAGSRRLF